MAPFIYHFVGWILDFIIVVNEGYQCNGINVNQDRSIFQWLMNCDEMSCRGVDHVLNFFDGFAHKQCCLGCS